MAKDNSRQKLRPDGRAPQAKQQGKAKCELKKAKRKLKRERPISTTAEGPPRRYQVLGILLLSFIIEATNRPDGPYGTWPGLAWHWLFTLYFTAGYWLSNRMLWEALLRRLPRVDQTVGRLWALAALATVVTGSVTVLLTLPLHLLQPLAFSLKPAALLIQTRFSLIPTAAVLTLYEATYFFQQWEQNMRRADQLARAETEARLDALRGQLDPHFLFNNLNTLAALIEPGNEFAQHFVEQLADVYRYVLLSQGQPTVSLGEEMTFVETYLALHKVRFRDNLRVVITIAPAALVRRVAPLSVQLLVENALKHNVASQQHPLHLRLTSSADAKYLTVESSLRLRTAGLIPGTGTGLANVRHRYELLGATQPVTVTTTANTFTVTLPLLAV